ncbi:flagellar basal body P-ring formation chaperone FlgA [Nitrincola sp. A-D6]|uniref:flagellar basal body P-ring formation chaperone FlgA n=1 Tax=Nitrincola sp. A-D6 TaxID=1545442 RepID=UPI0006894111|nr:flagellar basal body P-ring formation chaperone FlgA [Nitrincola sp. A-D6]
MNTVNLTLVALFLAIFLAATTVNARMLPEDIEQQVHDTLINEFNTRLPESRIEATINPVNPTLELSRCQAPLEISLPFSSGQRVTAKVTCHTPVFWSLFVTAQVSQLIDVIVTSRPLARNSRIAPSDIRIVEQDVIRMNGDYFTREQDVVGKQVRRPMGRNEVITSRMIEQAVAVSRGDKVVLESRRGSLVIRTSGIAMEDGMINQQIRVTNERTGIEVHGVITAPGVVQVH